MKLFRAVVAAPFLAFVAVFYLVVSPAFAADDEAGDCATADQKYDAIFNFMQNHAPHGFGGGNFSHNPTGEDAESMAYDFGFMRRRGGCWGVVWVEDDCTISDVEGEPISDTEGALLAGGLDAIHCEEGGFASGEFVTYLRRIKDGHPMVDALGRNMRKGRYDAVPVRRSKAAKDRQRH